MSMRTVWLPRYCRGCGRLVMHWFHGCKGKKPWE